MIGRLIEMRWDGLANVPAPKDLMQRQDGDSRRRANPIKSFAILQVLKSHNLCVPFRNSRSKVLAYVLILVHVIMLSHFGAPGLLHGRVCTLASENG